MPLDMELCTFTIELKLVLQQESRGTHALKTVIFLLPVNIIEYRYVVLSCMLYALLSQTLLISIHIIIFVDWFICITCINIIKYYYCQRDGGVVLSRVVSFSAGAPAGGFLAPV